MKKVLTLNNISAAGLSRFPLDQYDVGSEISEPNAIILRSHDLHNMEIPASVEAIGRAGAGVNNIPIDALSQRGVPVFNTPGANANAVKELVVAGLLISARNLCTARNYVRDLKLEGDALTNAVEAGKKQFVGFELPGRTLGVVGLGAVGVYVANAALSLGMKVIGFDPGMTVRNAWQLSAGVEQVDTIEQLFDDVDAVTVHVPLIDRTRNLVDQDRLAQMRKGGILINFSRGGVVDVAATIAALDSGALHAYVCDFPTPELIAHDKVIAFPHLGASTAEAEENCAVMIVENVRDYLENGNISLSVNFPQTNMPRTDAFRITIANKNVPNMVGQISTCLANAGLNIEDLLNKSVGELAYTLVDLDGPIPQVTLDALRQIDGVLALRDLGKSLS